MIAFFVFSFFSCIFIVIDIRINNFEKVFNFGIKGALIGVVYFVVDFGIFEMNTRSKAIRQTPMKKRLLNSIVLAAIGIFVLLLGHGVFITFKNLL